MIIDPPCINKVLQVLPGEEVFFKDEHRIIYGALIRLYISGDPIDAVTLRTELKRTGQLEAAGGVEYLAKILDSVPSSANAVYYSKIVRTKQQYRQLISTVKQIETIPIELGELSEKIQKIQELALNLEVDSSSMDFVEVSKEATNVATEMFGHQEGIIKTGFCNIDEIIGGVAQGELCILAGRPSMGKSGLALDMALNMSQADKGVLIFTLEMTERSLVERIICNLAKVNLAKIKTQTGNTLFNSDRDSIYKAASELKDKANIILTTIGSTPEQLISLIRRLKKTHNISCVFIDYLQLMNTLRKTESRQQALTEISRKLKAAAVKEQLPIVALSQLNRAVDKRKNHRPRMSDLRESGALEQDADLVLFIYREDYYRKAQQSNAETDGKTEVIVAKNRRGPIGTADLVFLDEFVKFGDLTKG
ncbi:MAG: replicative DNA helicase [Planctomycetes bacterium]|nr:replicative DNA helicase [Planctomycetota bacterium]